MSAFEQDAGIMLRIKIPKTYLKELEEEYKEWEKEIEEELIQIYEELNQENK
jgi:hypothetical protein